MNLILLKEEKMNINDNANDMQRTLNIERHFKREIEHTEIKLAKKW